MNVLNKLRVIFTAGCSNLYNLWFKDDLVYCIFHFTYKCEYFNEL